MPPTMRGGPQKADSQAGRVGPVKKGAKLLLVLLLILAGGALAYAGAAPEAYRGVADVAADPGAFAGREVELKASVVPGSVNRSAAPITFVLADGAAVLPVEWDASMPLPDDEAGGGIEGKNVLVRGVVVQGDDGPRLLAREMKVGCASKYRPA